MWCSSRTSWARVSFVGLAGAAALLLVVFFAYHLALARVPQHRATLERLVRVQTGLDVRFSSLSLRWGWYGPEAVFKDVELGEPGQSNVLLRAPELTVGFDAWRTLRSGQLAPGRIALVAPDIDLAAAGARSTFGVQGTSPVAATAGARGSASGGATAGAGVAVGAAVGMGSADSTARARARVLERWRDGRIDIEGGQVRLPNPYGASDPFSLQIRRASVRRSGEEWDVFALVFLPERLGRTARIVMRLEGALERPQTLSGSLRLQAQRVSFAGWRDLQGLAPRLARYAPVAGGGDVTVNLDFSRGRIVKADGTVHVGGVALGPAVSSGGPLQLDRLRGQWRWARQDSHWRLAVDDLELGAAAARGSLIVDADFAGAWFAARLDRAPLSPVTDIVRWLAPEVDFAAAQLNASAQHLAIDWNAGRPAGQRLRASARLDDLSVAPASHSFVLGGMSAFIMGDESAITADLQSQRARLELTASPQRPLETVHVAGHLRITRADEGWRVETDSLELRHERARLSVSGALSGGGARLHPEIDVHGELSDTQISWLHGIVGADTHGAFGPAGSWVSSGHIDQARFELRGPVDGWHSNSQGGAFSGSATLRDVVVTGGDPWPDATGVSAQLEWRDNRVRAVMENGSAGPFQLATMTAEWDAEGHRSARFSGTVRGRLEDAAAWLRRHPGINDYAPQVQELDLRGATRLDFDVTVPGSDASGGGRKSGSASVAPRVVASFEGATFRWVAGSVPLQDLAGSLVFDGTRLRRSSLSGTWLGGPVTLRVSERREQGRSVLAMQAHGIVDAQLLAAAGRIDLSGHVRGLADWSGELTYLPASDSQPARWNMHADSNLLGVESRLADLLAKKADERLALHVELSGSAATADLRVTLGERLKSLMLLEKGADSDWHVARASARVGTASVLYTGGGDFRDSSGSGDSEARLEVDSPLFAGVANWSTLGNSTGSASASGAGAGARDAGGFGTGGLKGGAANEVGVSQGSTGTADGLGANGGRVSRPGAGSSGGPVEIRLTRLALAPAGVSADSAGLFVRALSALGRTARVSVDTLSWAGRDLGRVSAVFSTADQGLALEDIRLSGGTHDGGGTVRCQAGLALCRVQFTLESSDAAATLADFGLRPDIYAAQALLSGDLEWRPGSDVPWPAALAGRVRMRLAEGTTRAAAGTPLALLSVPALVAGMEPQSGVGDTPGPAAALSQAPRELRFSRLEADFELHDGEASTTDLHFDGDAEILMRGRIGLVARNYDQQVWILKGEERLPAAVRRLGPSARMAAAWLALRDFMGSSAADRTQAVLHLQGSWDEPEVVAANR